MNRSNKKVSLLLKFFRYNWPLLYREKAHLPKRHKTMYINIRYREYDVPRYG